MAKWKWHAVILWKNPSKNWKYLPIRLKPNWQKFKNPSSTKRKNSVMRIQPKFLLTMSLKTFWKTKEDLLLRIGTGILQQEKKSNRKQKQRSDAFRFKKLTWMEKLISTPENLQNIKFFSPKLINF